MRQKKERFKGESDWTTFDGFEDGERGPQTKECECLLEVGNSPLLTASKEMGLSVLQPQGTELRQQPE